jgi:hypothetical protein
MFFLDFIHQANQRPVLAHVCYGEGVPETPLLQLCTSRLQANELANNIFVERRLEVLIKTDELSEDMESPGLLMRGKWAGIFGSLLVEFKGEFEKLSDISVSHLCGIYGPPREAPNDAVILWFDKYDGYKVSMVYSAQQACQIIESFDWMDIDAGDEHLKRIRSWKMSKSSMVPITFTGPCACILCIAALAHNAHEYAKRHAH